MKIELPPEKQSIIDSLSNLVAEKRAYYEAMGIQNVYGLSEADLMRNLMAYALARADLWNAEEALRAAIRSQEK